MFAEATRQRIEDLTAYFMSHGVTDHGLATHKAVVAIGLKIRQQSNVMAFSDTFFLLGSALLIALVAVLLLKKSGEASGAGAH